MKESTFQKCILDAFAHDRNVKMFRRNVGGMKDQKGQFVRFGQAGQSDLYGWIVEHRCPFCNRPQWGTYFAIEVKGLDKNGKPGKLTQAQADYLEMVSNTNGIAIVAYPEANDPIGLRERIYKLLVGSKCPQCVEKSSFTKEITK